MTQYSTIEVTSGRQESGGEMLLVAAYLAGIFSISPKVLTGTERPHIAGVSGASKATFNSLGPQEVSMARAKATRAAQAKRERGTSRERVAACGMMDAVMRVSL